MKSNYIFILFLLLASACDSEKISKEESNSVNPRAVELSHSAMERFQDFNLGTINNSDSLEVSLTELEKAIELEPNQIRFYSNKVNVLLTIGREDEAIEVLRKSITINPDFAEGLSFLGFIYSKRGENETAQEWFQKASKAYNQRIEKDRFVVNSKVSKAFLLHFTEDKDAAKEAFEKVKQKYPENSEVLYSEQLFTDFDKEQFLMEFYH